ncbi:hypothetical protein F5B20DRAFT_57378 [Whalleya microplaca]|nr:hypothetical protein F5B20DRAFT_57378 [Whalleya microplaca]
MDTPGNFVPPPSGEQPAPPRPSPPSGLEGLTPFTTGFARAFQNMRRQERLQDIRGGRLNDEAQNAGHGYPGLLVPHQGQSVSTGQFGRQVECLICGDSFTTAGGIYQLGCRHMHCTACVKNNAKSSLESMPFAPAKCCQVIPKETLKHLKVFTDDEFKRYVIKLEELVTPHKKLYCWGEDCGAFIPMANNKKRVGQCDQCARRTCKKCGLKSHFGPCDQSKIQDTLQGEEQVLKLAKLQGWKRCVNCLNLVQKDGGCNHMSCTCGQQFCYKCGHAMTTPHQCVKHQAPAPWNDA